MTGITGAGAATAIPAHRGPRQGGCPHEPKPKPGPDHVPMPMPMPGPVPLPPRGRPPIPPPGHGTPPMAPPGMHGLSGGTTRDIARGILELYDRDHNGTISSDEAVRVQREYGGFNGGMIQVPGFGGHTVDVFSMTKLFIKADANRNGRVGVNELSKVLEGFDTGDRYRGVLHQMGGLEQLHGGLRKTAGDGRLSGSEFDRFMQVLGEQHVGSWQERTHGFGFKDDGFEFIGFDRNPPEVGLLGANTTRRPMPAPAVPQGPATDGAGDGVAAQPADD